MTGYLEDGVILDIMDHHYMWFLTCVPNFSSRAWMEVFQEPPIFEVILGGSCCFLAWDLEEGVILEVMDGRDMWFLNCVPNFSSLAWTQVCQELPRPRSDIWRTLMVPDWSTHVGSLRFVKGRQSNLPSITTLYLLFLNQTNQHDMVDKTGTYLASWTIPTFDLSETLFREVLYLCP